MKQNGEEMNEKKEREEQLKSIESGKLIVTPFFKHKKTQISYRRVGNRIVELKKWGDNYFSARTISKIRKQK